VSDNVPLISDPAPVADPVTEEVSPREQITRLVTDFRTVAADELAYYKARFAYSTAVAKWTGIYVAIALFALFGTVVALILGLLLILAAWVGAIAATIIVTLSFAGVALLFAQMARRNARNLSFPEIDGAKTDGGNHCG
jgi:small-conductance mechanosensitive channel